MHEKHELQLPSFRVRIKPSAHIACLFSVLCWLEMMLEVIKHYSVIITNKMERTGEKVALRKEMTKVTLLRPVFTKVTFVLLLY